MGNFSLISFANEEEFSQRYSTLNIMGKRIKNFLLPRMPGYVSGVIADMGVKGLDTSGCRICIPPHKYGNNGYMAKAVKKAEQFGADILVLDPRTENLLPEEGVNMIVSRGTIYTPYTFIDAVKKVASLMGIDFKRSNICIADASVELGITITELLLNEVLYLTLCTSNKEKLISKLDNYMKRSGLSPAVVSNNKKAMTSCDILIYAGGYDVRELLCFSNKKILIANLTGRYVELDKDVLIIDDVVLKGSGEPVINGENIDETIFLTSRMWEGALLSAAGDVPKQPGPSFSLKLGKLADKLGIEMKGVVGGGRILNRETIYRYR